MNHSVWIEDFAQRHFIKSFKKKYKMRWDVTLCGIIAELERIDALLLTDRADSICHIDNIEIIKTDFKIAGTNESAKSSGDRCIVVRDKKKQTISILLVYGKTDLNGANETAKWKRIIKDNYPQYKYLF